MIITASGFGLRAVNRRGSIRGTRRGMRRVRSSTRVRLIRLCSGFRAGSGVF